MFLRTVALALALLLMQTAAHAVQPDEVLADPQLEIRARALSAQLRCMVCQNESIDESHAALARDLRLLVRERLKAGDSDEEIRAYLVSRYGEFILLKLPLKRETWLLWASPFAILAAGGVIIIIARRKQPSPSGPETLSEAEQMKLKALAGDSEEEF